MAPLLTVSMGCGTWVLGRCIERWLFLEQKFHTPDKGIGMQTLDHSIVKQTSYTGRAGSSPGDGPYTIE